MRLTVTFALQLLQFTGLPTLGVCGTVCWLRRKAPQNMHVWPCCLFSIDGVAELVPAPLGMTPVIG